MKRIRSWTTKAPEGTIIARQYVVRGLKPREDDEQARLFDTLRLMEAQQPLLRFVLHTANQGTSSAARGAKLKRMGVRPGVWDISCDSPSACGTYQRFRLEMKIGSNGLSEDQLAWAHYYRSLPGNTLLAVCYSARDAWAIVAGYFNLPYEEGTWRQYANLL